MKVTPDYLEKLKAANNIVDIVGEHVVLKKSGSQWSGLCPFHAERSPSFTVSEQRQLYHCYGCKAGGDLVEFIKQVHGLSFPEAIEELAERAKLPLPAEWRNGPGGVERSPEETARLEAARKKLETARKLNRFAVQFYQNQLHQKEPVIREYLSRRGVTDELQREFYVGAAPSGWDGLGKHLKAAQAPLELAMELGLIRQSPKTQREGIGYYDLFRNRVMFPIVDLRGKVAGFGGRVISSEDQPKYLNSPESLLFHKSKVLYGLYHAAKHIREADEVVVVEGYFDVLALHRAGFKTAVATCGTALTPDHLNMLKKFASRITVLFDGDRAGIAAVDRAMELGLDHGIVLRFVGIPSGKDPDELLFDQASGAVLPEGAEQLRGWLTQAEPILDYRMRQLLVKALESPEAKSAAIKEAGAWLGRFKDPIGRDVRLQDFSEKLGIQPQLLRQAMGGSGGLAYPSTGSRTPHVSSGPVPAIRPVGGGSRPAPVARTGGPPVGGGPPPTDEMPPMPHEPPFFDPDPRAPSRPPAATPRPAPRGGSVPATRAQRLTTREKLLLQALFQTLLRKTPIPVDGFDFFKMWDELHRQLSPEVTISDLFDHSLASRWVSEWIDPEDKRKEFERNPNDALSALADVQLRSILMEFLLATDATLEADGVKGAFAQSGRRILERFSHQVRTALAAAEANKDAGLEAHLKKEYLDVQRRMKEFINFYDQDSP